jgi:predicted patatin/cPLA2 family phospholipase
MKMQIKFFQLILIVYKIILINKNFHVVISDADIWKARIHRVKSKENYINQMLATGSLPVLMKNPIYLRRQEGKYDGGITDPIPVQRGL